MSERTITISPYSKADNIIALKGHVNLSGAIEKIDIPEKNHLILYNYTLPNGNVIVPREYDSLKLFIRPSFTKNLNQNYFNQLLVSGESSELILKLRIFVECKNTRWSSSHITMNLSEITGEKEVYFNLTLTDIKEEITVIAHVTRESSSKKNEPRKANSIYSIISTCEEISIQIDERKEIGGNHLPIFPEDIGELLFDIHGIDNEFDLPVIKYHEYFKDYFVRDNNKVVSTTFMMGMFYFLDTYLKWLIFKCKYDSHDKDHKGLIDLLSKYCGIPKTHLIDLVEEKKYNESQIKNYLSLSHRLFHGIQIDSSIKYSKELKQILKED